MSKQIEALKLALEALEEAWYHVGTFQPTEKAIDLYDEARTAIKEALAQEQECWCTTCRPITMADMRFVVCPDCDNKRCPKANDHRNACTNSNEVGQKGSSWEHVKPLAQPEQDHIPDARKMVTEQEPVAHCEAGPEYCPVCNTELNQEPAIYPEEAYEMGLEEIAFYTAPPRRTWVGLTDEERDEICLGDESIARSIEAKLREKNGGNHES